MILLLSACLTVVLNNVNSRDGLYPMLRMVCEDAVRCLKIGIAGIYKQGFDIVLTT